MANAKSTKQLQTFISKELLTGAPIYEVFILNPRAHTFRVKLTLENPKQDQIINFSQWIAGSYMIREFSKHLHNLIAKQNNKEVLLTQISKSSWRIHCNASTKLILEYDVYAHDGSVRGAWLDAERGFFNGTSLFFECVGHAHNKHFVLLHEKPIKALSTEEESIVKHWRVFTSLEQVKISKSGFGLYQSNSFEDLVDTPVLMSDAWSGEFTVETGSKQKTNQIVHRFAITGASDSFDGERLLADAQKICKTIIDFWHPHSKPVIKSYLFILNVVHDGYGGLEHKNSTVLQCKRTDLPSLHKVEASDGYIGLLGLISHEYFHTWNVKRLRPAEFSSYKFNTENYTNMLWFFEGFTSYYDDLLLRRSGLITNQQYLKLINKTITQVQQTPGRYIQSVAQSSFDAWIKYYKADENTPNITVSYYTKGALIAMCFDLKLRAHNTNLDAVMRELFKRSSAGPISESDFVRVLEDLSDRSWSGELKDWVHGTKDLPVVDLLQNQGVKVEHSADSLQQQLGLRVDDTKAGLQIKIVLSGGIGEQSGFVAGDEWLGIKVASKKWRIHKLDDLMLFLGKDKYFEAIVCRDQRLLTLRVKFSIQQALTNKSSQTLSISDETKLMSWLN